MKEKTAQFLKSIGFSDKEIDIVSKKAGHHADRLPRAFMRQLLMNFYVKEQPTKKTGRKARKLSSEDFVYLIEIFKREVLEHPLKAVARMAKRNILIYRNIKEV